MFSTILLSISAICFMVSFWSDLFSHVNKEYCGYQDSIVLSAIPPISGFILAVIPQTFIFDIAWYWVTLINIPACLIIGPIAAKFYHSRLSVRGDYGPSAFTSIIPGIIALGIGLLTA